MKTEHLEVNGKNHLVKVHYEHRHNSAVSIGKKAINIRIPSFLDRNEAARELIKLKIWAREKLKEKPDMFAQETQREYMDGDVLKVGNDDYFLRIELKDKRSSSARITGNMIELSISSNIPKAKQNRHVSALISRCIAAKRLPELKRKLDELNKTYFNHEINKIFFKNLKSKWGSCSDRGNINISTRLLFAPEGVLEYVCIHELSHLVEKNHSGRFWALVEKAIPDYKDKNKWLKENGGECTF